MVSVINIVINSITISALYALIAIGFTLIFGVGGVLNLTYGAVITIGAYVVYAFTRGFVDIGIAGAIIPALIVGAVVSGVLYNWFIRHIQDEPIVVMILTLLIALVVEELFAVGAGSRERAIPLLWEGQLSVLGQTVQQNDIAVFVLSWLVIIGIFLFINRTTTGQAIVATSMSTKGAALVGINTTRINLYTWIISGMLAAIAGLFLGSKYGVYPGMGLNPLILAFTIVVLGGIGSIRGSVVGAYLIGTLEVLTASLVSHSLTQVIPLVVLVVVLIVKPEGLFGRPHTE